MTKEQLAKIINDSLERQEYDWERADREELGRVLTDIEEGTQTEWKTRLYFDTIYCEHPIAIQVFTEVKHQNKTYNVIIDFDMTTPIDADALIDTIWEEYQTAQEMQKNFNS